MKNCLSKLLVSQYVRLFALYSILLLAYCGCDNNPSDEKSPVESIDFLQSLNQEIKANPTNDSLLMYRAKLLLENSYIRLATLSCEDAWKIKPSLAATICKCQTLIASGEYTATIHWLNQAMQKIGASNTLLLLLAEAYQKINHSREVLSTLQKVDTTKLNPNLAFEMATLSSDIKAYDLALRFINIGLQQMPSMSFSLMKAHILIQLRHSQTLPFLNGLKNHPEFEKNQADVWYLFGNYYYQNQQLEKAYNYYEKATQQDFRFQSAYISKAQILKTKKQYPQAMEQLYIASEVDKPTATLLEESGDCSLYMQDTAEAIAYYQSAYKLDSTRIHLVATIQKISQKNR